MSREIDKDFEQLNDFIRNYSISTLAQNDVYVSNLKKSHKIYFSYAHLIWGINHQNICDKNIENRLLESCSDIGQVILLFSHGLYKPANLILRSSIENFIKAIGLFVDTDIVNKKHVYEIFDIAKQYPNCSHPNFLIMYNSLKTEYSNLCSHTHTANQQHMMHLSAFKNIPIFDKRYADELIKTTIKIVKTYITILVFSFRDNIFKINPSYRDIVLTSISDSDRRLLYQGNI